MKSNMIFLIADPGSRAQAKPRRTSKWKLSICPSDYKQVGHLCFSHPHTSCSLKACARFGCWVCWRRDPVAPSEKNFTLGSQAGEVLEDELNYLLVHSLMAGVRLHCLIDACYSGDWTPLASYMSANLHCLSHHVQHRLAPLPVQGGLTEIGSEQNMIVIVRLHSQCKEDSQRLGVSKT
jgi:hypothetical protein